MFAAHYFHEFGEIASHENFEFYSTTGHFGDKTYSSQPISQLTN